MIPKHELMNRWSGVKRGLERNNYDALLIPLGIHFYYLFGKLGQPSERLIAGIIPRDTDPFIIAPRFEKSNIELTTNVNDIIVWEETESPYDLVAQEFEQRKIGSNIGVDPKLWLMEKEKLEKATDYNYSSAHELLDSLRSVKSEWEITQLKAAAKATSNGILNSISELRVGITELEFLKVVQKEMSLLSGNSSSFGIVQFGKNSAIPHGSSGKQKLKNDDVVLIDCGTPVNGYQGDITITVPYGKPKNFEELYEIVFDANVKAFEENKENVQPAILDKIARDHITQAGYGIYFTHRLGHGLGLEVHETPYIVASNQVPLIKGNCHTIEPGIYIPGKYGIRIEDDVLVKQDTAERLFDTPRHNF